MLSTETFQTTLVYVRFNCNQNYVENRSLQTLKLPNEKTVGFQFELSVPTHTLVLSHCSCPLLVISLGSRTSSLFNLRDIVFLSMSVRCVRNNAKRREVIMSLFETYRRMMDTVDVCARVGTISNFKHVKTFLRLSSDDGVKNVKVFQIMLQRVSCGTKNPNFKHAFIWMCKELVKVSGK